MRALLVSKIRRHLLVTSFLRLCVEVVRTSNGEVVEELEPNTALMDLLTKFSLPRIKEFKVILAFQFYSSTTLQKCGK
jgi:hypothetical protein